MQVIQTYNLCMANNANTPTHTHQHTHNLVAEPVLIGTGFWVTVVHRHSLSQNQQHALKEKEREGGGTKNDYQQ